MPSAAPSMLATVIDRAKSAKAWATAFVWLRRCTTVGARARTFKRPHIENGGRIVIGARVRLNSNWAPVELGTGPGGAIEIGDDVYVNYGTLVSAHQRVRVGNGVMIGNYTIIADTDIPGVGVMSSGPALDARAVEIGDRVWLAARVTVLPGTRIGAGAVVAAGSVVAGDVPPGAVVGGIPARVLRMASDPATAPSDVPIKAVEAGGAGRA